MHGFPFVSLLFPEGKQSETIRNNQAHFKSSILTAVQIFDLKSMQGKQKKRMHVSLLCLMSAHIKPYLFIF